MLLRRLQSSTALCVLGLATTIVITGSAATAGAAAGTSLLLPSATAFSILGHSCGGIQEQAFATGFAPSTGLPTGAVYLQTRCGGSGRGGGYRVTTYSAWAGVTWDFSAAVQGVTKLATAPVNLDPAFAATDARGDAIYNVLTAVNLAPSSCSVGNTSYCTYRAYLSVPVPGTPTAVGATQAGDALTVTWTPAADGGLPTSSTVTATPVAGGTTLTATSMGAATSATLTGIAASTTYSIVVASSDASGAGPASTPLQFTTHAASTVPGAPTGTAVSWSADGSAIQVRWTAPSGGDSPISDYQVSVAQYDPTGPATVRDVGVTTSASLTGFNNVLDWSVQVRALNSAGWGPWSSKVVLGGL